MSRSSNPDYIDWLHSEARQIILDHLRTLVLPVDENEVSAREAWEYYRHLPAFLGPPVVFEQFSERLADHRQQVGRRIDRSQYEMAAMYHDQLLHPYPTHNHRGQPNFHQSPAQPLILQDIAMGRHGQMSIAALWMSRPLEYATFTPKKFKEIVHQTIKRKKLEHWIATRGSNRDF